MQSPGTARKVFTAQPPHFANDDFVSQSEFLRSTLFRVIDAP